jgi:hypothetical protein
MLERNLRSEHLATYPHIHTAQPLRPFDFMREIR